MIAVYVSEQIFNSWRLKNSGEKIMVGRGQTADSTDWPSTDYCVVIRICECHSFIYDVWVCLCLSLCVCWCKVTYSIPCCVSVSCVLIPCRCVNVQFVDSNFSALAGAVAALSFSAIQLVA